MRDLSGKLGKTLTELQEFFRNQRDIAAVYIFGSFGTEFEHQFSDIDLGVVFSTEQVHFEDELRLAALLSQLLKRDDIDVINLNKAPINLRYRVVSEGVMIIEGNYEIHSDFLAQTYKRYLDYLPDLLTFRREYGEALKEAYHG